MSADRRTIATALAHGMLAADSWAFEPLVDACGRVLDARPGWLWPLVDLVLDSYRRAPHDSARALTGLIAGSSHLSRAIEAARLKGTELRIAHLESTPAVMLRGQSDIPRIDGLAQLANFLEVTPGQLDWLSDTAHWNRRTRPGRLHHYSYSWLARPGRTPRLLEVPGRRMRTAQRTILREILHHLPLHPAVHGFVPGRSAASGAREHTGSALVIALDLSTFFARVPARRIYGILRQAGYPEAVAHSLTGICSHAVPPFTLRRMPPGGSPEDRFALRQALSVSHLPQGSPTSPTLSNLAVRRLDSRLAGWAHASGARYTRYADDLAFSGGSALKRRSSSFVAGVERIVEEEGHRINRAKTRVSGRGARQTVTGLVVNEKAAVPREYFDELKAILHNCALHGAARQNRDGHPDFRAHLLGRLTWVESLSPSRGARLRRDFELIDWS